MADNHTKWGRATARKRYPEGGPIFEGTDAYYAKMERDKGVPEALRSYGNPDLMPPTSDTQRTNKRGDD